MMIINRDFCKVLTVIFFIEIIVGISTFTQYFMPGFHYSHDGIARLIILFLIFGLTSMFYNYITISKPKDEINEDIVGADGKPIGSDQLPPEEEIPEDIGDFVIKGEKDYLKLAIVGIVIGVILILIIRLIIEIILQLCK